MKPTMTYKPFSIVVVPFPFTEREKAKRRPALVLSNIQHQSATQHITLLMITSAKNSAWESDYLIHDLETTGLTSPSIIRQKIFTIDLKLILKLAGKLSPKDQEETTLRLHQHLLDGTGHASHSKI